MMCGNMTKSVFLKVPASELSLDDEFMKYQPTLGKELLFKEEVESAIQGGLKDFWRPKYDPSLNQDSTNICYVPGKRPAVGKSYNWWKQIASNFKPECGSRLGNRVEYTAFIAVLIKKLVASGWTVEDAWGAVLVECEKLGHYTESNNAKDTYEDTGCREVCGFCDLGNTSKILAAEDRFTVDTYFRGGSCYHCSSIPLANIMLVLSDRNREDIYSVGWLVFDSCPDC